MGTGVSLSRRFGSAERFLRRSREVRHPANIFSWHGRLARGRRYSAAFAWRSRRVGRRCSAEPNLQKLKPCAKTARQPRGQGIELKPAFEFLGCLAVLALWISSRLASRHRGFAVIRIAEHRDPWAGCPCHYMGGPPMPRVVDPLGMPEEEHAEQGGDGFDGVSPVVGAELDVETLDQDVLENG
jgi:hypothetical protein